MEIQQTHRKINRPIISLALVGVLMGTELGANTPNDPIHSESRAFFTTVIIPAIVGEERFQGFLAGGSNKPNKPIKPQINPIKFGAFKQEEVLIISPTSNTTYTNPFYPVRLMEVGTGGMPLGIIGSKTGNGTNLKWICKTL